MISFGAVQTDPYTFTNGTVANATEVNLRISRLYTLQDGAIDAANLDLTDDYVWAGDHTFTTITDLGVVTAAEFTTADINGGTIDGVTINSCAIGGTTPASGIFSDGAHYGAPLVFAKTIILPEYVKAQIAHVPILPVELSWAPFGIKIREAGIKLDANRAYSVNFEDFDTPAHANAAIVTVATGAGEMEQTSGAIDKDIAAGNMLAVELPVTTGALFLMVWVTYELKAS